jgi:predicted TIM-barrel fold metal-dependent hydrolase
MIIDFEHHYVPVELARRLGINTQTKTVIQENGVAKANIHSQLFNLDAQIEDMNRAGIDVAVQTCILGWDTTLENCRLLNDCTARIQKEYAGRFVGLAHVPPLEGAGALAELERAVGELDLRGVTISSQVNSLSLDAMEFRPFFEAVANLHVPIFIHPALAPKGYDLLKDYQLSVILTREFDLGVAVTRLIAGGILERYPELELVFSHFGGGLAGYKERIARSSYRFKLPKRFDEYFDCLYFDMAGFEGSAVALRPRGHTRRANGVCHRLPAEFQQ